MTLVLVVVVFQIESRYFKTSIMIFPLPKVHYDPELLELAVAAGLSYSKQLEFSPTIF